MEILIDTSSIKSRVDEIEKIKRELFKKRDILEEIQQSLNDEIKYKNNIYKSISDLKIRITNVEDRIGNIKYLLLFAAERYEDAERSVLKLLKELLDNLRAMGFEVVESKSYIINNTKDGYIISDIKLKKYAKWAKLAVGVVVVGVAIASVVATGGASAIAIGAAVGASATGAAVGVVNGIKTEKEGKGFLEGFSDGFMKGAVVGAVVGAAVGGFVGAIAENITLKVAANTTGKAVGKLAEEEIKYTLKDRSSKVLAYSFKSGLKAASKSEKSGKGLVEDFIDGSVEGAKEKTSDIIKEDIKGGFGDNEAIDIIVDATEETAEDTFESIVKNEDLSVNELGENFKDNLKEKVRDWVDEKTGLSSFKEYKEVADTISDKINNQSNNSESFADNNSSTTGGGGSW